MNWQIIQGDCIEVMAQLSEASVDLVLTDPPYGIDYKSGAQGVDRKHRNATNETRVVRNSFFERIAGDGELPTEWLREVYRVLRDGSALYIFCHWTRWHLLYPAVAELFTVKNMIVLSKSNHGMGDLNGQYAPKHELLLYAVKGRHLLNRENGRAKDVWDVPVRFSGAHRYHPNEKPLSWLGPCIKNSSKVDDLVLDPFVGSGSTGVACLLENRRFIGIEKDEKYVEIARQRLIQMQARDMEIANK